MPVWFSSFFFSWPVSQLTVALWCHSVPLLPVLVLYLTFVSLFSLHLTMKCCLLVQDCHHLGTLSHPQHRTPDLICWGCSGHFADFLSVKTLAVNVKKFCSISLQPQHTVDHPFDALVPGIAHQNARPNSPHPWDSPVSVLWTTLSNLVSVEVWLLVFQLLPQQLLQNSAPISLKLKTLTTLPIH